MDNNFHSGRRILVVSAAVLIFAIPTAARTASTPDYEDHLLLLEMLQEGRFSELDARFSALQKRYAAGKEDDRVLGHAYGAFCSTTPGLEASLDEWVKSRSDSYHAHISRGMYRECIGWERRGGKWAEDTSDRRMQAMADAFEKAVADFGTAMEIDPERPIAYAELVRIMKAFTGGDELRNIAYAGLEHDPKSYMIRSAYAYALHPKWGGSMDELVRFANETERHIRGNAALATIRGYPEIVKADGLARAKLYDEALKAYNSALRFGERAFFHGKRGDLYYRMGRYESAIADYTRALELWPYGTGYLRKRGDALRRLGRTDDALKDYERALAMSSLDPDALEGKAMVLMENGRNEEALKTARDVLEYGADSASNWYTVGWLLYYEFDEKDESARYLKRATELNPDSSEYWYLLSAAQYETRDCAVTASMNRFLKACDGESNCDQVKIDWAKKARADLLNRGICE